MNTEMRYDTLSKRDHEKVARFVNQQAGIQLPPSKRNLIETRLRKRQRALAFDKLSDYITFALEKDRFEQVHLIDALTTNKTEFFREASHYAVYTEALEQHYRGQPVSVWSAGCSSGEEPYTLAMVALDAKVPVSLLATDISVSVLRKAKRAIYPHESVTAIPLSLRSRFLLRRKHQGLDEVKMSEAVRHCVQFDEFNLITGDFNTLPRFDIIFCRNVMIYFDTSVRQQLTREFYRRLNPRGYLFIGHSESLSDADHLFHHVAPTIYQKQE